MGELTVEQKRAIALATARQRMADTAPADTLAVGNGPTTSKANLAELSGLTQKHRVRQPNQGRSFAQGAADIASFGLSDEAAALVGSLGGMLPGGHGKGYDQLLPEIRDEQKTDAEEYPKTHLAGMGTGLLGSIAAGGPLTMTANALRTGAPLTRVAATSSAEGGILGMLQGFGSGEGGAVERGKNALTGGAIGLGTGLVAPLAIAGLGTVGRPLVAPIMSRFRPDTYANQALNEGLTRSGQSVDDISRSLTEAQTDGQGMFNVADAMGNSGQRMLSTVTRTPNDARQGVIETLMNRQGGQGRRVAGALEEGFGTPMTAAQQERAATTLRRNSGNMNYGDARAQAQAVDAMPAIAAIDNVVQPGTIPTGASETSVGGTLNRFRNMLTNENGDLVNDFDRLLLAKQDMDVVIEQGGTIANLIRPARNALDDQLAAASAPYSNARDTYRQQSQALEAVDTGRNSARRGRVEDTIPAFQNLAEIPGAQQNFRAGYVDPLIESAQGAATGVNKVRPLINDATAAEFPAFAAPGQGPRLQRRLGREQTMFETNNQAMGGSRTSDNLADAAEMHKFDPGVLTALFKGKPIEAVLAAVSRMGNEARGLNPRVIERVATALMETHPDAAQRILTDATNRGAISAGRQAVLNSLLNAAGSGAGGRVLAP